MNKVLLELIIVAVIGYLISLYSPIPYISLVSLVYGIVQVINLLNSFGKRLPFRELIISIMGVQMIIAPYLEYHYFQFRTIGGMAINEVDYFSYVLPCTILLKVGLQVFYPSHPPDLRIFNTIASKARTNEKYGLGLILFGYAGYVAAELTNISSFAFLIYLLSLCRFIGFLYLWICNSRFTIPAFIFVIIPFTIEAVNSTILVEVIVYFAILLTILFLKLKSGRLVIYSTFILAFLFLILAQSVKYKYRIAVSKESFSGNRGLFFFQAMANQVRNFDDLDLKRLGGGVNVRINQGWVLSDVLKHMMGREEKIEPKYFYREVAGVLLPRFIYPAKPMVGDHKKFKEYTGYRLSKHVAMTVGLMGDGFGNFGYIGGMLYCLGFGMLMGWMFKVWYTLSEKYPTLLLWGVLIFFYSMRAGDETYTIINWVVKSSVLVLFYFYFIERSNSIKSYTKVLKGPAGGRNWRVQPA